MPATTSTSAPSTSTPSTPLPTFDRAEVDVVATERRGLLWVFGSFVLCPCHLPLTLGVLATVLGGTSLGALLRDHAWVAGTVITLTWLLGTAYGFRLLRRAQRTGGACPVREP
ncbi:MAG: hypothetical protein R2726_20220 [Acidimicrobiales bacterium]